MSEREGGQTRGGRGRQDEVEETPPPEVDPEAVARQEKLTEDVDSVLDEIDAVLEENAEEFVRGYVQKGGE